MRRTPRVILAVLVITSLLASFVLLGFGKSGASSNSDTMSAYLKLDETSAGSTAVDSSGDGNNGTPNGSTNPVPSVDVPTTSFLNSRSLSFSTDQYLTVPDSLELNPSNLTVSAWVKFNSLGGTQTILAKWDDTYQQQYSLELDGGNIVFQTGDGLSAVADSITSSAVISTNTWYSVVGTINGTNRTIRVGSILDSDTAGTSLGSSVQPFSVGAKQNNDGAYFEFLDGLVDEVRVYSRAIDTNEQADLRSGDHTYNTWTGSSSDYETAGNWSVGAVPDPYSNVTITNTLNKPTLSADVALSGLTINSGARLNLAGYDLTINDGGSFTNNGTLQLKNTETLTGFNLDSDSGTVLVTPDSDTFGLITGNTYNNLIINDSTFAYWPLDESSGTTSEDISGFGRTANYNGSPTSSSSVPDTNYANDNSLSFNGSSDYVQFGTATMPNNATWCSWINMDSGSGVVLGSTISEQYAMKITGGNTVEVRNQSDDETISWGIGSVYGGWHHICINQTKTITSSLNLYVDGAATGSTQMLTNGVGEINTIGRGGSSYFDGLIDEVRIYNRLLSPTEISKLYAGDEPEVYVSTTELTNNLDVNGDLVVSSGRLDVSSSNYSINIAGDLRNDGGVFNGQSGSIVLDGSDQLINSSFDFYDLTKQVVSAATLSFGRSSTTTINNSLTLNGASGQLLSLRSSTDGEQWIIDPIGNETISYLDVKDSNNIDVEPVDITDVNITDSGNNINWTVNVAPDTPTSLGPTQSIDGNFITDNSPTFNFSLADDNPVDQLRYRIVIDDSSDFSSPVVDYVSDLGSHGARTYTVGDNGSDDTYNVGSDSMLLTSANYYWQVRAIDDYDTPNESAYAVANGGSIAFRLDVSGPTDPGVPTTSSTQTNKRPVWTWTASTDAGIGLANPTYTIQWSTSATFSSGVGAAQTNNLTYTHGSDLADGQWYFRVRASDTLGNNSAWSTSTVHIIDTTGPTTPVAPFTATPTYDNTPTWSWAAVTDAGVGMGSPAYQVQWSETSNFSSGVESDTSATNIFTHTDSLTDTTWYIRVRGVDALGNYSAWSSNGTVLIDGTAPSNPGQPSTTNPTNDNTPTWNWASSIDIGSGLSANPYSVQWSQNSSFSPTAGSTTTSSETYTHGTPLADGTWYIRVNAKDNLNNTSGFSVTGQTTIDTVAPDKPEVPTTTTPTNDDTPTWTWAIPDDTGVGLSATPYTLEWSQDNTFGTGVSSDTSDTNSFTHDDPLGEGDWYFRVYATDSAGNTSVASDNGTVYIDLTPPTVPGEPSTADPIANNTPTWTWSASSDSGIGLDSTPYLLEWSESSDFSSGVITGTSTTNTFTHTDPLADGTWYFRVSAIDAVTNQSAFSTAGSKVVDVSPPTVPGNPSTTTPSADNTPTWTWSASTDVGTGLHATPYMIEWSEDNTFLSGVTADTITPDSFTHTDPLADGTWYFRVRAQDLVGNISAYSGVGTVVVDVTAPTTPGNPSTTSPTNDDTPTWTWTASTDSGVGLANPAYAVEWSEASDFSSGVFADTSNTNSFTQPTSLADGTWYFRVRAMDIVNNTSTDSPVASVEIDDTAPSVPGTPTTDTPTNDQTPTWTWTASTDNGVGLADPEYEVRWSLTNDFSSGVFADTSSTNSFTHTDPLADGTWYFEVRALDTLNNISAYSASGSVLVSTSGPTKPGVPSTTDPTTDQTPTWTWTASTSLAGLKNPAYTVEWSEDNTFLSGVSTDISSTNSFTHVDDLADGVWYVRIIAEDNTDLYSSYSDLGSVLVDTTAPSVPGEASTTDPNPDNTPTWTWTASTDSGVGLGSPAYTVEWSQDNTFSGGVNVETTASATFTHTDQLADGTWYFRVKAIDDLGNESSFSSSGTVQVDSSAPSVPGTPSAGAPAVNDQTPTWTWTASTDSGVGLADPAYIVEWSQSSSFSGGVTTDTTNSANYTHVVSLADGTWYFRVKAIDDLGNESSFSSSGTVQVDSSAPSVPGTPSAGAPAVNDQTPTWTWTASTDSGVGLGSPQYQVQWSQDEDFIGGVISDTAGTNSFTHSSDISPGVWYFRVRAVDVVNNTSGYTANGEVYVDVDLPSSPDTPATAESPTADRTPTWTWTASIDGGFGLSETPYEIEWSQDSAFLTGVSSDTSDTQSYTHTTNLTDGTWYLRVRSVDGANNNSSYSPNGTVIIDATVPTTPADLSTTTPTEDRTPTWTWTASTDSGVGLKNPSYEIQWSRATNFSSGVTSQTTNSTDFTHSIDLADGFWYFRVRAVDSIDNKSAWLSSEVSIDFTAPVVTQISSSPGSVSSIITWTTDEESSTQVVYGVGGQYSEITEEEDTATRVTAHGLILVGLNSCTTYQYKVVSVDFLENNTTSPAKSFTTTNCSGNSAITAQTNKYIPRSSGGSVSLVSGSANFSLSAPANYSSSDVDFQIKQLSPAAALGPTGQPEDYNLLGSHVYDLKAMSNVETAVTSFSNAITTTVTFTETELDGFNSGSLAIFRHDGSGWQKLNNCSINLSARTVTCQTSGFSVFGLFGTAYVPPPPLPVGEGTTKPEPDDTEIKTIEEMRKKNEPVAETAGAENSRGIGSAVSKIISTVKSRPSATFGILVLIATIGGLAVLTRKKLSSKKSPYGIHKDDQ